MDAEKQAKFINDFLEYTGINLEELVADLQPLPMTVAAFINRAETLIITKIKSRNPTFREAELSEYEKEQIYKALLEQVTYMANVGDYSLITGYDPISNQAVPIEELRKRQLAPLAIAILKAAGLFYCGLRRGHSTYADERRYWS